ncbi:MAG: dihydroxy-acid dehydratase, partial [Anaerolineae bacterium]|nr:dihydroxy-acid dehydratase [Anaerolineae bacterium]
MPVDSDNEQIYHIRTHANGPQDQLPLDAEYLRTVSSGDLFGLTEDAGMGWPANMLRNPEYLILATVGGQRAVDGYPVALGYHTGHWETDVLIKTAAQTFTSRQCIPFAGLLSDPCDGRTQGTPGMMDSLPFRNDAAIIFRRLIRSLPTRRGVLGIATCDKGLPALLMALAAQHDLPCVFVPGGVTLPPTDGEDAGKVQTLSVRYALGEISLEQASVLGCRACASPGGGCQFLGTAATGQVVGEALGMALLHSALAPSGQPVWLDNARRSAHALMNLSHSRVTTQDIITTDA